MVLVPKSYTLPLKCARKYPIHDLFLFIIRVVILELVRWKLRHLNRRRDCYPTQNWLDTLQNASMCLASAKLVATKKKHPRFNLLCFFSKHAMSVVIYLKYFEIVLRTMSNQNPIFVPSIQGNFASHRATWMICCTCWRIQKSKTQHHASGSNLFAPKTVRFTLKTYLFCSNRFQTKQRFGSVHAVLQKATCCVHAGGNWRANHVLNRGGSAFG